MEASLSKEEQVKTYLSPEGSVIQHFAVKVTVNSKGKVVRTQKP